MRILMVVAALAAVASSSPNTPFRFDRNGRFPSGLTYSVSLRLTPFARSPLSEEDDGSMWGIDGGFPHYVVKKLSVSFGATEVVIHKKFLTDICDISSAWVRASTRGQSNELVLHVKGGDGAGAYEGEYRFIDCRLTRRSLRMGEAPDEVWERLDVGDFEVEGCGRTKG